MKCNSRKHHLSTTCDNFHVINVGGNQVSTSKYEKMLGKLIYHRLTFEYRLLDIVKKDNQQIHGLAIISSYMPQKISELPWKHLLLHNLHIVSQSGCFIVDG